MSCFSWSGFQALKILFEKFRNSFEKFGYLFNKFGNFIWNKKNEKKHLIWVTRILDKLDKPLSIWMLGCFYALASPVLVYPLPFNLLWLCNLLYPREYILQGINSRSKYWTENGRSNSLGTWTSHTTKLFIFFNHCLQFEIYVSWRLNLFLWGPQPVPRGSQPVPWSSQHVPWGSQHFSYSFESVP